MKYHLLKFKKQTRSALIAENQACRLESHVQENKFSEIFMKAQKKQGFKNEAEIMLEK